MAASSLSTVSGSTDLFGEMRMPAIARESAPRAEGGTEAPVKEPEVKPEPPETTPPPGGEPMPAAPGPVVTPEEAPDQCPGGECDF